MCLFVIGIIWIHFYTSSNQSVWLITEDVWALIGHCASAGGSAIAAAPVCARLAHANVMKSSWRDDVLCWRLTVLRRAPRVRGLLIHVHVQDGCPCLSAQSQYKPTVFSLSTRLFFFSFSFSHLLPASRWSLQLQMFVPVQFSCLISHIWSLSAVCWSMKVWTTVGCQGQRFERREVMGELILTSPSPQRLGNTWRVFGHRGFLFIWAWSFGFEMKQEKTHTFNI